MLRLVMTVRAAPRALAWALVCSAAACGTGEPELRAAPVASPPPVRGTQLAIQRRADGLEQVDLRGRLGHVTRAHAEAGADGGVRHHCASEAP